MKNAPLPAMHSYRTYPHTIVASVCMSTVTLGKWRKTETSRVFLPYVFSEKKRKTCFSGSQIRWTADSHAGVKTGGKVARDTVSETNTMSPCCLIPMFPPVTYADPECNEAQGVWGRESETERWRERKRERLGAYHPSGKQGWKKTSEASIKPITFCLHPHPISNIFHLA